MIFPSVGVDGDAVGLGSVVIDATAPSGRRGSGGLAGGVGFAVA
ncbi:MAG TPA: hypothetical protein PKC43_14000 [Phycisphaerales bacterium]|nr:hypothetical protein [Phycisphaerales bacterium]HMP38547.1 hypothetical protein [Phycisphaerales bacterium]